MAKNLYNLTAVTTVNDSDLLHVNQGSVSSDKKVTKANLLKEVNSSISSINNSLAKIIYLDFTLTKGGNSYYDIKNHVQHGQAFVSFFQPRGFVVTNIGSIFTGYRSGSNIYATSISYPNSSNFRIVFDSDGRIHNTETTYDVSYSGVIILMN